MNTSINPWAAVLAAALSFPLTASAQRPDVLTLESSPRTTQRLEKDWRFHRGDIVLPQVTSHHANYTLVKAGNARGPAGFRHDDSTWQRVDLPHDYVVDGKYQADQSVSHGFQERVPGWYRKQFRLDPEDRSRALWLYFDGVMGRSRVWVNGQELVQSENGYIGFRVNLTDVAHYGDTPNTIAVRTDPTEPQGWWYEGGGIYRHVWLVKADRLHVAPFGLHVSPKPNENGWDTRVSVALENDTDAYAPVKVVTTIHDSANRVVATATSEVVARGGTSTTVAQSPAVPSPKRWDLENPALYRAVSSVFRDGKLIDQVGASFGYRTLEFTPDKGIFLNGKPVKLKGVCMHHDHAGVGVAVPDAIQEFRVARMKQMGANAWRCSHNPPASEVLEACDRLGMLVMNENRFYNSGGIYLEQLREQVRRDRNHPSVIMWSLFNEEPWQGDERGRKMVERMRRAVRQLDDSRPVTGAMNGGFNQDGAFNAVDIIGINYFLGVHDQAHKLVPDKHVYGSENVSHFATRGEWKTDNAKKIFDNYDHHCAGWGSSTRAAWKHVATREWDGGMFIWTGFDYRGEPTPHAWPVISSYFGIVDTCGFAKDSFYLCKALWTEKPMAHVFPHWNLGDEMIGKPVKVGVYTNGDEYELLLNGKSLGRKKTDRFEQAFQEVVYQPGKLELKTYKHGALHATAAVETTGKPAALRVEAHFEDWSRDHARSGESDAIPVAVCAVDEAGRVVPVAKDKVAFHVDGGRVLGVGNGDPLCHEPDRASARSLFNGYACAIVEPDDSAKTLRVVVSAPGLKPATLVLPVRPGKAAPQAPSMDNTVALTAWRLSSLTVERQDPNRPIADNDMNTWEPVRAGDGPFAPLEGKSGYATARADFDMPAGDRSYELQFTAIRGGCEVFINGRKAAEKSNAQEQALRVPLDAAPGSKVVVSVLLKVSQSAGFTQPVLLLPGKGPGPKLEAATAVLEARMQAGDTPQSYPLPTPAKGRYLALETLSSHGGDGFVHAAELAVLGADGKPLPVKPWKVLWCDSEETEKDHGRATNLIDNKPATFWHTRWSEGVTPNPHVVLIDLGGVRNISAVRLTGRPADKIGGLNRFRIHLSETGFPTR